MARNRFKISTEGKRAISTAGFTTMLQLAAPANIRVALLGLSITFDGVTATGVPVEWQLHRESDAGTGGVAVTEVQVDDSLAETVQSVGLRGPWATTEPTAVANSILKIGLIHPMTGYERVWGPDEEIIVGGSDRVGVELSAAAAVNADVELYCEE